MPAGGGGAKEKGKIIKKIKATFFASRAMLNFGTSPLQLTVSNACKEESGAGEGSAQLGKGGGDLSVWGCRKVLAQEYDAAEGEIRGLVVSRGVVGSGWALRLLPPAKKAP